MASRYEYLIVYELGDGIQGVNNLNDAPVCERVCGLDPKQGREIMGIEPVKRLAANAGGQPVLIA